MPKGAYPRSRGATTDELLVTDTYMGLSPLARGNRAGSAPLCIRVGPIPARAGQPKSLGERTRGRRAYPRSRGATTDRLGSFSRP